MFLTDILLEKKSETDYNLLMSRNSKIALQAKGASAGIAIGKVFLYQKDDIIVEVYDIEEEDVEKEHQRLDEAIQSSKNEILALQDKFDPDEKTDVGEILKAHIQLLEDKSVISQVKKRVADEKKNIDYIYNDVALSFAERLRAIKNEIFAERAHDIIDIRNRVLRNLASRDFRMITDIKEPVVVVAHNLTPGDTLNFDRDLILGFAVDIGGTTSHTAILSRSLGIPAVVGLKNITSHVKNNDTIIVDGIRGNVIVNPDTQTLNEYTINRKIFTQLQKEQMRFSGLPASTSDDVTFTIESNIELPEEVEEVKKFGAEGIGLYRTEFLYINTDSFPKEEEQFENYKKVVVAMDGSPVTIRTLDLGGDKFLNSANFGTDENPFLGWRAIRFCLANPEIFKTQIKAILRASIYGKVSIMFPMISSIEEFDSALALLNESKEELTAEGIPFSDNIKVGIMIETPAAAIIADKFAKKVDFFSIGTNDLIQYTLAVDRTNERISYLYEPMHLAVLTLIKKATEAAHKEGIPIAMCGEMAGEPLYAPVLIGLGVDILSMASSLIPEMKKIIRSLNAKECREFTDSLFEMNDTGEVKKAVASFTMLKFPDYFSNR